MLSVSDYVSLGEQEFGSPIFVALAGMIRERKLGVNFVERILRVPLGDAGGIHGFLASR